MGIFCKLIKLFMFWQNLQNLKTFEFVYFKNNFKIYFTLLCQSRYGIFIDDCSILKKQSFTIFKYSKHCFQKMLSSNNCNLVSVFFFSFITQI